MIVRGAAKLAQFSPDKMGKVTVAAGDTSGRIADAPGLHPWAHAVLEIRDDAVGDARMDIDARAAFFSVHDPNLR